VVDRIDQLASKIRRYTGTQSYVDSATGVSQVGLQTQSIVDSLNEALQSLHAIIYNVAPGFFIKTDNIDVVLNTEQYTLPDDVYLVTSVLLVEYLYSTGNYIPLKKNAKNKRAPTNVTGIPYGYIQHYNKLLLNPLPSQSITDGLRVTYEYTIPEVDIRRGKISAYDSASNPTSITITENTGANLAFGSDGPPEYISVVDKDGTIQMDSIFVSSYSSSSGVLTVSVSASAGEAIAAGDYVVVGKYASSHPQIPIMCQQYLIDSAIYNIYNSIGHPALAGAAERLIASSKKVAENMADAQRDIFPIPRANDMVDIDYGI